MAPHLSIIIPLYNAVQTFRHTFSEVISFLDLGFGKSCEMILVDDGSGDGTFQEAQRLTKLFPGHSFQLIRSEKNRGKGYSISQGVQRAQGRYLFFMDSDLSTPLSFVEPFLSRLKSGTDIVMASRFEKGSRITTHRSLLLTFLSWSERKLIRIFSGLRFSDTQCGFKGFRAAAAKKIFSLNRINRFCFDVEILFLAARFGFKIETCPVHWGHNENTKVRWRDPLIFLWDLLRIRWYARRGCYE